MEPRPSRVYLSDHGSFSPTTKVTPLACRPSRARCRRRLLLQQRVASWPYDSRCSIGTDAYADPVPAHQAKCIMRGDLGFRDTMVRSPRRPQLCLPARTIPLSQCTRYSAGSGNLTHVTFLIPRYFLSAKPSGLAGLRVQFPATVVTFKGLLVPPSRRCTALRGIVARLCNCVF
jgi:hypothetical protein